MNSNQLAITIPESRRLIQLEAIVQAGKQTFVEVGNALAEIRDSRLYRSEFTTFEEYCRVKWGWSRIHAHRIIEASETVKTLPMGNTVTSERQARELARVEPESRTEVLRVAQETAKAADRPMTAKDIRNAALPPMTMPENLPEPELDEEESERTDPAPSKPHVANNSGENEWYTPPQFIDSARVAMGGIDLDPASCTLANQTVRADMFFGKEDDGLSQTWRGRVWLNPPYAQPLISEFAAKVSAEFECGNIDQACVLVNNATDTTWFQRMMESADCVCFPKGRIRFIDKHGNPSGAPLQGQAILYFGTKHAAFRAEFKKYGFTL